jgi:hypothetical protein
MQNKFKLIKDEFTEKLHNFDLPNIQLTKSTDRFFYFCDGQNLSIEIPESRLNSEDFEFGLAHELTEITLRKLLSSLIENLGNLYVFRFRMHEVTILSLERYNLVANQWDILERDYEKAFQDNLKKLLASQKNPSSISDSKKERES